MARHIEIGYPDSVEVGTRADDGRLGPESLYIVTTGDRADMRVLTKSKALETCGCPLGDPEGLGVMGEVPALRKGRLWKRMESL